MPDGNETYRINEQFFQSGDLIENTSNSSTYNTNLIVKRSPQPESDPNIANRSIATGVPGYLTQADLLARLGHVLTVRGDTFIIRAYGDSLDPTLNSVARTEVCEAVVQRFPEYFDESVNDPTDSASQGIPLSDVNEDLGRKFRVVSFRWLSKQEI